MDRLVIFEKSRKSHRWTASIGGIDVSEDTYSKLKEKVIKMLEEELKELYKDKDGEEGKFNLPKGKRHFSSMDGNS